MIFISRRFSSFSHQSFYCNWKWNCFLTFLSSSLRFSPAISDFFLPHDALPTPTFSISTCFRFALWPNILFLGFYYKARAAPSSIIVRDIEKVMPYEETPIGSAMMICARVWLHRQLIPPIRDESQAGSDGITLNFNGTQTKPTTRCRCRFTSHMKLRCKWRPKREKSQRWTWKRLIYNLRLIAEATWGRAERKM